MIEFKGRLYHLEAKQLNKEKLQILEGILGTDKKIGEYLGCCTSNVGRMRDKFGYPRAKGRPKNTEAEQYKERVLRLSNLGMKPRIISQRLGICLSNVYKWLPIGSLELQKENQRENEVIRLKDMFETGASFKEMCKYFRLAPTTMRSKLSKAGLSIRERDTK